MRSYIPHSRPWIVGDDIIAVQKTLESSFIAQGSKVVAFEQAVKEYIGVNYAIAVASGSSAIALALATLSTSSNDEIIIPSYVCRNVFDAVISVGAKPVICDVNSSGVLALEEVSKVITKRTKAIIAVHIFGRPCNIDALKTAGVPVIEDACQAFGLDCWGNKAGAMGDMAVLSFNATKCLTTGEGGMLLTKNKVLAERARALTLGTTTQVRQFFTPLSDLQASLGISQLARYPEFLKRRRMLLKLFSAAVDEKHMLSVNLNKSNALFRFVVNVDRPFVELQQQFLRHGICIRKGVDQVLHQIVGLNDRYYPYTTMLFRHSISFPFYPSLEDNEVNLILDSFKLL